MTTDTLPADHIKVEVAFTTVPDDPAPNWTDISAYVDLNVGASITTGRGDEYASVQTGSARVALVNTDGRFTAGNVSSPYYPNVKIRKKLRISYTNPSGGATAYRFTGYVEEWPTNWPTGSDTYSTSQVTAVDRFKRLGALAPLRSVLEQEILADTPTAYYTLGEPEESTTAGDTSRGGSGALATTQVGSGGTLTFGVGTGPATDALTAPVLTPTNVTNGKYLAGSVTVVGGATNLTITAFMLTSSAVVQTVCRLVTTSGGWVELRTTAAGKLEATDSAGSFTLTSSASVNTGATYQVGLSLSQAAGVVTVTLLANGVSVGSTTYAAAQLPSYTLIRIGGHSAGAAFTGTISHVAIYGSAVSAARQLIHTTAGSTGFAGERSDQRIARLAGYAGITTAQQSLETGSSTSIAFVNTTGLAPLAAMQDVAATEGGVLFMSGAGLLTFHARSHRYNTVSTFIVTAGDVDTSAQFITNDALLINDATVARAGGITFRAVNAGSVTDYGTSAVNLTLLTTSDLEVMDAANWKANQSALINPRLPNLGMDLMTSPLLTATALLLTNGSRVTLSGLPAQAPAASVDLFVEGWTETISTGSWVLALNTSPAPSSSVWQLDSATYSQLDTSTRLAY